MKKLFLLLLLPFFALAQVSTGQEQEFDTGIKNNSTQTVLNAQYLVTQGSDGTYGKILPSNLTQTTAGISQRVWFTGDDTTVTAGTFFTSSTTGKGSTASASPPALVLPDNTKAYFTKDVISIAQPSNTIGYKGTYSGNLTVSASPAPAQQRFTVEIYRTNNGGTPIASGVPSAPVGDLGVTVIAILDSGLLNLTAGAITNVPVTGVLTDNITINAGERLRYHVSAAKVGAGGGSVTFGVYYGSSYNSYYDVPVAITTDAVLNKSTVTGITDTEALNTLNALKANDSGVLHKAVNETITSVKTVNNTGSVASTAGFIFNNNNSSNTIASAIIQGNNVSSGNLSFFSNTGSGNNYYSSSNSTGNNFVANTTGSGTGYTYVGQSDGVNTFTVTKSGIVFANSAGIGTPSPVGKLDVLGSKTTTYNASLTSPVIDFARIGNTHNSGGSDQFSTLALQVSGNNMLNNSYATISAIQPTAANNATEMSLAVRQSGGSMFEFLRGTTTGSSLFGIPTAPTATAGTNTTQIATTAFVQAATRPYKSYTALITQSGTSAPTATVLENTLGGTVTFSRTSAGTYLATLSGAFTLNKTACYITPTTGTFVHQATRQSLNDVIIVSLNSSNAATDTILNNTTFEIRVYN